MRGGALWFERGVAERGRERDKVTGRTFVGCSFYAFEDCFPIEEVVFVYWAEVEEGFVGGVGVVFQFAQ